VAGKTMSRQNNSSCYASHAEKSTNCVSQTAEPHPQLAHADPRLLERNHRSTFKNLYGIYSTS
jgi:hypothetical protein